MSYLFIFNIPIIQNQHKPPFETKSLVYSFPTYKWLIILFEWLAKQLSNTYLIIIYFISLY